MMNMKELFNKLRFKKNEEVSALNKPDYSVEVTHIKPIFVKEEDTYPGMFGLRVSVSTENCGDVHNLICASNRDFLYDADKDKIFKHEDSTVEERIHQAFKAWIMENNSKFSLTIPPDYFKQNSLEKMLKDDSEKIVLVLPKTDTLPPPPVEPSYSAKVKYTISDVRKLALELGSEIKDCVKVMNSVNGDIEKAREILLKSQEQQKKKVATKAKLAKIKLQEEAVIPVETPVKEKSKKPRKKSKKDISTNDTSKPLETNPKQPASST